MKPAFVFPGQGAQVVGMGKEFYDNFDFAKKLFDEADDALGYSISKICFEGSEEDLKLTRKQLLESLNLYDDGKLKRAAILLFHRNPEKWITGSWVKIGYFLNDADIRYQDNSQFHVDNPTKDH